VSSGLARLQVAKNFTFFRDVRMRARPPSPRNPIAYGLAERKHRNGHWMTPPHMPVGGRKTKRSPKPAKDFTSISFQKFCSLPSRYAAPSVGRSGGPVLGALVTPSRFNRRGRNEWHPLGCGCTGERASAKQSSIAIAWWLGYHARSAGSSSPIGRWIEVPHPCPPGVPILASFD
jgi:hypothetical protein